MKSIKKTDDQIVFSSDIGITLANSIRRYFNNISVIAVDELEISKNESPLYDETIAHRVGLVPLKSGKGKVSDKITLEVKRQGVVYSGDFKGGPDFFLIPEPFARFLLKLLLVLWPLKGSPAECLIPL